MFAYYETDMDYLDRNDQSDTTDHLGQIKSRGMIISVRIVDDTIPPTIGTAIRCQQTVTNLP
jgi:hypothetical protein